MRDATMIANSPSNTVALAFTLSMPGRASWNGRWSGENRLWCRIVRFSGKKRRELADKIVAEGPYSYVWSDGWRARIDVRRVLGDEARRIRRNSAGFAGYDWMIDTIILYGKPLATHEIPVANDTNLSEPRSASSILGEGHHGT